MYTKKLTPQYLKPLKLYTAVVNNLYKGSIREVHRYVFQTSRYADFRRQVESYHLIDKDGDRRDAIFQLKIPLVPADIALMYDIVTGTMSAANAGLAVTWADPFDRLVEGALKLTPLDAAISTEFNIVRNAATNAVVAVWIRNPEPFNDPIAGWDIGENLVGKKPCCWRRKGRSTGSTSTPDLVGHELPRTARECANQALELDPESAHAYRLLGLISVQEGDSQRAVHLLKRQSPPTPTTPTR